MKTFLINLDSRADRLAFVTEQLRLLNLDCERFSAVRGDMLTESQQALFDRQQFILEQKKEVVLGEIGCAISHRTIWQKMVDENLPFALILEDDIQVSTDLPDFLANELFYCSFDFLNLSSTEPYRLDADVLQQLKVAEITERPNKWRSRRLWRRLEWRRKWRIFRLFFYSEQFTVCECDPAPALGSGYILSLKGAKALLAASEKMFFPVDLTWRFSGGELRQAFLAKPLIEQVLGDTNIEGRYKGYKLSEWQKIQRFFVKSRRIKRRWDVMKMYGWFKL